MRGHSYGSALQQRNRQAEDERKSAHRRLKTPAYSMSRALRPNSVEHEFVGRTAPLFSETLIPGAAPIAAAIATTPRCLAARLRLPLLSLLSLVEGLHRGAPCGREAFNILSLGAAFGF